jgi:hypothetical protein
MFKTKAYLCNTKQNNTNKNNNIYPLQFPSFPRFIIRLPSGFHGGSNVTIKYTYFVFIEGPRSRCYGRTAALNVYCVNLRGRQRCFFFLLFHFNGATVEWNWQGKTVVFGKKIYPSATFSTTNPTWTEPGSNPCLRGERPATNSLSHGTAQVNTLLTSLLSH